MVPRLTVSVFIASPDDVAAERKVAAKILQQLESAPEFREHLRIEVVRSDDPRRPVAMEASRTPQESINMTRKPSACDITVVLLWSRLGRPFVGLRSADVQHHSGTIWELENAQDAGKDAYVFRRTSPPRPDVDPKAFQTLNEFFDNFKGGVNEYADEKDFGKVFKSRLTSVMRRKVVEHLSRRPCYQDANDFLSNEASPNFAELLHKSEEIWMSGLNFYLSLPDYKDQILAKVRAGLKITILIFDPSFVTEQFAESYGAKENDLRDRAFKTMRAAQWIAASLDRSQPGTGTIDARITKVAPHSRAYFFDPRKPDGEMYLVPYVSRWSSQKSFGFLVKNIASGSANPFFMRVHQLWESATVLKDWLNENPAEAAKVNC